MSGIATIQFQMQIAAAFSYSIFLIPGRGLLAYTSYKKIKTER